MPLLGEQKTCQIFLSIISYFHLQVENGSALVLSYPDGSDVVECGEGVREVRQLVAHDVENRELIQST